jgi:hypothetical protein
MLEYKKGRHMKRHVPSALLLIATAAATVLAQGSVPVKYPQSPGAAYYDHSDAHPVRPVYQQPLVGPLEDVDMMVGEYVEGEVAGQHCDACGDTGCFEQECIRPWDMWVRGEYLMWWSEGSRLPPLVTTSTDGGSGILGAADTEVVVGGDLVGAERRDGARITVGAWLDDEHCRAIEASVYFLNDFESVIATQSVGSPLLARPFFNVQLQTGGVQTIAAPDISNGGIFITTERDVDGAELVLRRRIGDCCNRRVDFLFGYRYAGLDELLVIRDELTSIDTNSNVPVGTVVGGFDSFETSNQFHGAQLGLAMDFYRRRWTLGLVGKVALGNMREQVTIGGETTVAVPGDVPVVTAGGLLAQPSNIGGFSRDEFAVVPEAQLNVRYRLTRNTEFSVGYTFIYLSDVVRPADQVDLRVDPRQITDPDNAVALPAFDFVTSDFWIQGINFGLEYKF